MSDRAHEREAREGGTNQGRDGGTEIGTGADSGRLGKDQVSEVLGSEGPARVELESVAKAQGAVSEEEEAEYGLLTRRRPYAVQRGST